MKHEMTDIHQHLLWGLDDGARTEAAIQQMLREAESQGITRVLATCHVCPGIIPFDEVLYRKRLAQAQAYCREHRLKVQVFAGAEVAWTSQVVSALRFGKVPTLGNTEYVLLELWKNVTLHEAYYAVSSLINAGYRPILAHVERYRCFRWAPKAARKFREETSALFQVNAASLLHPHGLLKKRFVRSMLRKHQIDIVATDAHGNSQRPINLKEAYEWLERHTDSEYAVSLTDFKGMFR